jgi:hypothetical protein
VARRYLDGEMERWRATALRWLLAGVALLLVAAGGYLGIVLVNEFPLAAASGRALALLLVGVGAATLVGLLLWRRSSAAAPAAIFAGVACLYLLLGARVLPEVDVYKSARPFCQRLNAIAGSGEPISAYRQWKWRASYVYYADRRIDAIDSPAALREYWARDERVFLIVEEEWHDEVHAVLGGREPLFGRQVGSRRVLLYSNR